MRFGQEIQGVLRHTADGALNGWLPLRWHIIVLDITLAYIHS